MLTGTGSSTRAAREVPMTRPDDMAPTQSGGGSSVG